MDDRGKYIHVTDEEMNSVIRFFERRGRVSLEEFVAQWYLPSSSPHSLVISGE